MRISLQIAVGRENSRENSPVAITMMISTQVFYLLFCTVLTSCHDINNSTEEVSRGSKLLNVFSVVKFPNSACNSTGGNYYGTCYTATECSSLGESRSLIIVSIIVFIIVFIIVCLNQEEPALVPVLKGLECVVHWQDTVEDHHQVVLLSPLSNSSVTLCRQQHIFCISVRRLLPLHLQLLQIILQHLPDQVMMTTSIFMKILLFQTQLWPVSNLSAQHSDLGNHCSHSSNPVHQSPVHCEPGQ